MSDSSDFLPYKGHYYADVDQELLWDSLRAATIELFSAHTDDERAAWLAKHLPSRSEPADNDMCLWLLFGRYQHRFLRVMYQCEKCGSLLVQREHESTYDHAFTATDVARVFATSRR